MEIEVHEHVKGEHEVDRVVLERKTRLLEEDEAGVALSGQRDLRLLEHLLRDVQAVVLAHARRYLSRDAAATRAHLGYHALRIDEGIDVLGEDARDIGEVPPLVAEG